MKLGSHGYYRRIVPLAGEKHARSKSSGLRFWDQHKSTASYRVSYPFEVPMFGEGDVPKNAILCRIDLTLKRQWHYLLGTRYFYRLRLWATHRRGGGQKVLCIMHSLEENLVDWRTAIRRGSAAAYTLFEQLTRQGLTYSVMHTDLGKRLAQENENENRTLGSSADQITEDWDPAAASGPDSIQVDDR